MSQKTHTHFGGHAALPSERAQRKPRGPMAQKVPPVEEENPRVSENLHVWRVIRLDAVLEQWTWVI